MRTAAIRCLVPIVLAAGAARATTATQHASIAIPLAAPTDVTRAESPSLSLRVSGDPGAFDIEVTSRNPVRGCPHNLVHRAPHGPDPSEVLPWQVTSRRFADTRWIAVCGFPLVLEVSIADAQVGGAGGAARFTAGTLRLAISGRRVNRSGSGR